jgi:tetratricopeptide (TPR) repeat protein
MFFLGRYKKRGILISIIIILLCSILVSASTKMILKVNSENPLTAKQAIDDLKIHPFMLYFKLGVYFFYQGKYSEAISSFRKAISIKPDFAEAYHNIGVSYHEEGQIDNAITEFQKAVEMDGKYAKGHYSLGLAYYEKKEYDKAITELEKVIELEPNAQIYFDAAIVYVEKFRTHEAAEYSSELDQGLAYYVKCLELNPAFPHAQQNKEIVEQVLSEYKNS